LTNSLKKENFYMDDVNVTGIGATSEEKSISTSEKVRMVRF